MLHQISLFNIFIFFVRKILCLSWYFHFNSANVTYADLGNFFFIKFVNLLTQHKIYPCCLNFKTLAYKFLLPIWLNITYIFVYFFIFRPIARCYPNIQILLVIYYFISVYFIVKPWVKFVKALLIYMDFSC